LSHVVRPVGLPRWIHDSSPISIVPVISHVIIISFPRSPSQHLCSGPSPL
jgi:hypothetical protein